MRNAAWWELISSWQYRIAAALRMDLPLNAKLPHYHDER